ncbi:Nitric oxide-associated protein 1 [Strongyloides ratti]|uniref:Nitric oxide-associated protein 1 n=1 Tax=Strongyloides ratti TaxID=34506 RepID=A0A090MUL5_STRRB|nr:Nitric oxide-associated protein 1 [Strongyloides ratti]CEF62288.1 Nitric oxide-associated protein 1 [Strongyloides ratti]
MIRKVINVVPVRWITIKSCLRNNKENIKETIAKRYKKMLEDEKLNDKKLSQKKVLSFDSLAVENFLKNQDKDLFDRISRHNMATTSNEENDDVNCSKDPSFPMRNTTNIDFVQENNESDNVFINPEMEKGYHVTTGDLYQDYQEGCVGDLEADELTIPEVTLHGPEDAVERIEFQLPGQAANLSSKKTSLKTPETNEVEALNEEKNIEADIEPSKKTCVGCGANFQCNNTSLPGFVPFNKFLEIEKKTFNRKNSNESYSNVLCRRCHLLKEHNFLLNVAVSPLDYEEMMGHLKLKEALILLVVDVTDLPYSIYEKLPDIIGHGKPIIVIGNKVDLLPPDAKEGYLKNFRNVVFNTLKDIGFNEKFNILHIALVSAKTGYGIEELITQIYMKWTNLKDNIRSDIYLVGNTNAGKSSIFNVFLQSDLCKVRAIDLIERACASPWPGTTMSLLKFPVMNISSQKMEIRRRRLLRVQAWLNREERSKLMLLRKSKDNRYATLMGYVENSFKHIDDKHQPTSESNISAAFGFESSLQSDDIEEKKIRVFNPNDPTFAKGTWCYDTPGVVNESQLMNIFTLNELIKIFPRSILSPRTFILNGGQSLLIGGISEISNKEDTIFVTVFCSEKLPINTMNSDEVDEFLKQYLGKSNLVVPCGNEKRMALYPKLEGTTFEIYGKGNDKGSCDITISSIGWLMITSKKDQKNIITVKTPSGKGIFLRDKPMLPYSISYRGSRIGGTQEYKVKPLNISVLKKPIKRNGKKSFKKQSKRKY